MIGLGVVGCGSIAYWVHLRIARNLRGARLVAASDPDLDARKRAAALARIHVYTRTEDLLARKDVHAVIVSGPTHLHAELVISACEAGKHVYLEKPLALSTGEGKRVIDAASRTGMTVSLGSNRRFHPLFEQARQILSDVRIGRIHAVQTTFCELVLPDAMPQWKRKRATGGGVLLDLASHHIDLLRWLLHDEVAKVDASIESDVTEHDSARLELAMKSGVQVQSWFSCRTATSDALEFAGELGTLRVDRHHPRVSLRLPRRFGYGMRTALVAPPPPVAAWWIQRMVRPSLDPSYRRALSAFVAIIGGEGGSMPGLVDGLRALEVVEAAEESALQGSSVGVHSA